MSRWLPARNATTIALTYLLIVLWSWFGVAVVGGGGHLVCGDALHQFLLPASRRADLTVADPENWVALVSFLAVSLVASRLSAAAHDRAAMATERAQFLEERKTIEVARKSEELKSALLASLAHDLGTPLTAIRVAASNLQRVVAHRDQRREQSELVLTEVERLQRLFQNILEMARIDAGAIALEHQWVHPLGDHRGRARAGGTHAARSHPLEREGRRRAAS